MILFAISGYAKVETLHNKSYIWSSYSEFNHDNVSLFIVSANFSDETHIHLEIALPGNIVPKDLASVKLDFDEAHSSDTELQLVGDYSISTNKPKVSESIDNDKAILIPLDQDWSYIHAKLGADPYIYSASAAINNMVKLSKGDIKAIVFTTKDDKQTRIAITYPTTRLFKAIFRELITETQADKTYGKQAKEFFAPYLKEFPLNNTTKSTTATPASSSKASTLTQSSSKSTSTKSSSTKSVSSSTSAKSTNSSANSRPKAIPTEASIVALTSLKSSALRNHNGSIAFQREMPFKNLGKKDLADLLSNPLGISQLSWNMDDAQFINKITEIGYGYEGTYKHESYHTFWTDVYLNIGIDLSETVNLNGNTLTFSTPNSTPPSLTIAYDDKGNYHSVNASIQFKLSNLTSSHNITESIASIKKADYNKAIEDYYKSLLKKVQAMNYKVTENDKTSFSFRTNAGVSCTISYRLDKNYPWDWSNITIRCYKSR